MIKRLRERANEAWLVFQVGATLLAFLEALRAAQDAREAKTSAAIALVVGLDLEEPEPADEATEPTDEETDQ